MHIHVYYALYISICLRFCSGICACIHCPWFVYSQNLYMQIHTYKIPCKVLCVWVGRVEIKDKQFFHLLTFVFYVKFPQNVFVWTERWDHVLFCARPTLAQTTLCDDMNSWRWILFLTCIHKQIYDEYMHTHAYTYNTARIWTKIWPPISWIWPRKSSRRRCVACNMPATTGADGVPEVVNVVKSRSHDAAVRTEACTFRAKFSRQND